MRPAAVLAAIALAACAVEPTRIVVVADSDLASPFELDEVRIDVDATAIGGGTDARATAVDGVTVDLPVVLPIVHDGGALGPITVRAAGLRDGAPIVERSARLSFVPRRSVVLRLELLRACLDADCDGDRTCSGGACVPWDVEAEALPPWTGRDALGTLMPTLRDAGAGPDAAIDDAAIDDAAIDAPACAPGCECAQSCVDDVGCECTSACACTLACVPGSDCTHVVCDGLGTVCAIDGAGTANLEAKCDHDASCTIDARDASNAIALSCKNRSQCQVDCRGASNCRLGCESGSQCLLTCSIGASCDLACSAGERRWCGEGVFACNRACP